MNVADLRQSLPAVERQIYLNSGASAPSPRRVLDAIIDFLELQAKDGPFTTRMLELELAIEAELRETIGRAIGASTEEITLCSNTSHGLNLVANGIDWREGDEVVVLDQEHPSGLIPWLYLRDRKGIVVRIVRTPDDPDQLSEAVASALNGRTRLVCLSHVSWCTGAVFPVRAVVGCAHKRGVPVVVDGAQGVGHLPVDVKALGCDFYCLSGQKWLMGPHGTGALYISGDAAVTLGLSQQGWASAPLVSGDGSYTLFPDGRRYELATTNHGLLQGLIEALKLYAAHGPETVWRRIQHLSEMLRDLLSRISGIEVIGPTGSSSGLVVIQIAGVDPLEAVTLLADDHGIICRPVEPPAVRFSVHIFNTEDELERVAAAVSKLVVRS